MVSVYVIVANAGGPDTVVSASSDAGAAVTLHDTAGVEDGSFMVDLERLEVPARGTLTLSPGGRHLMLHHLFAPLDPGDVITVTIVFERSGPMVVEAPVRSFNELATFGPSPEAGSAEVAAGRRPPGRFRIDSHLGWGHGAGRDPRGGRGAAPRVTTSATPRSARPSSRCSRPLGPAAEHAVDPRAEPGHGPELGVPEPRRARARRHRAPHRHHRRPRLVRAGRGPQQPPPPPDLHLCGNIEDFLVPEDVEDQLNLALPGAARRHRFKVTDHILDLFGTCKDCAA